MGNILNHIFPLSFFLYILLPLFPYFLVASNHDTTYYKKYDDRLIASMYISERRYNIKFNQLYDKAPHLITALDFQADANTITGFEFAYDKIGFSFGVKARPPLDLKRKGKTDYKNFNFSFGGNRWLLETAFRHFKGFYENNTVNYTPAFDSTDNFYQDAEFLNQSIKAKFIYFFNHKKFSYKSAYACSYRQLKSSFSWIVVSNLHHNKIATDTSFIPSALRFYYNRQGYLNRVSTVGLSFGGGFSGNLVLFKKFFFNLTLALNPELQFVGYSYYPQVGEGSVRLNMAGDLRSSFGYNGKKFFVIITNQNDITNFGFGKITINNTLVSGAFSFGYRFGVKTPKVYEKFKETKIYGWL